jgi:hypothetical protein
MVITEASACGGPARARVAREESAEVEQPNRARNRDRTDDLILTKDVLYRLSYASSGPVPKRRGSSL